MVESKVEGYSLENDGILWFKDKMYVLENGDSILLVMEETDWVPYSKQIGVKKMHINWKMIFLWARMKWNIL